MTEADQKSYAESVDQQMRRPAVPMFEGDTVAKGETYKDHVAKLVMDASKGELKDLGIKNMDDLVGRVRAYEAKQHDAGINVAFNRDGKDTTMHLSGADVVGVIAALAGRNRRITTPVQLAAGLEGTIKFFETNGPGKDPVASYNRFVSDLAEQADGLADNFKIRKDLMPQQIKYTAPPVDASQQKSFNPSGVLGGGQGGGLREGDKIPGMPSSVPADNKKSVSLPPGGGPGNPLIGKPAEYSPPSQQSNAGKNDGVQNGALNPDGQKKLGSDRLGGTLRPGGGGSGLGSGLPENTPWLPNVPENPSPLFQLLFVVHPKNPQKAAPNIDGVDIKDGQHMTLRGMLAAANGEKPNDSPADSRLFPNGIQPNGFLTKGVDAALRTFVDNNNKQHAKEPSYKPIQLPEGGIRIDAIIGNKPLHDALNKAYEAHTKIAALVDPSKFMTFAMAGASRAANHSPTIVDAPAPVVDRGPQVG